MYQLIHEILFCNKSLTQRTSETSTRYFNLPPASPAPTNSWHPYTHDVPPLQTLPFVPGVHSNVPTNVAPVQAGRKHDHVRLGHDGPTPCFHLDDDVS